MPLKLSCYGIEPRPNLDDLLARVSAIASERFGGADLDFWRDYYRRLIVASPYSVALVQYEYRDGDGHRSVQDVAYSSVIPVCESIARLHWAGRFDELDLRDEHLSRHGEGAAYVYLQAVTLNTKANLHPRFRSERSRGDRVMPFLERAVWTQLRGLALDPSRHEILMYAEISSRKGLGLVMDRGFRPMMRGDRLCFSAHGDPIYYWSTTEASRRAPDDADYRFLETFRREVA